MGGDGPVGVGQLGFVLLLVLTAGAIGWGVWRILRRLERSTKTAGRDTGSSLASGLESIRDSLRPNPTATRAYRGGLATVIRIVFYAGAMPLGCFTLLAVGAAAGSALLAGLLQAPPVLTDLPSTPGGALQEIAGIGVGLVAAVVLVVVLNRLLLRTGMRALDKGFDAPPETRDPGAQASSDVAALDAKLAQPPEEPPDGPR